ncbi:AraC family transcriptional regulator [Singulisphaera acidiphila]|uniref:DNA-binding domain-containing protein, AraC-type n=1 Tax=Singulisphaera acidiphila (strain ATCC BAA-1392 / DSM 18658 / VKM B-2454 / MOB10) TaxID=886293 RepID=L0DM65_SINAD|nr:AraC family transcriptional regulator [Singulisphaera acidiphila]AGA29928.1 DNA-binding domain-containing protein, AraC-type [Singulisphaera acidiphila DSM 18658]
MDGQADNRKRLASLLDEVAVDEGMRQTLIEGVQVFRRSEPLPRTPMVYHQRIIIVGQGWKRAYLGGNAYTYDSCNYLVSSVPLPVECETEASLEVPVLIVTIDIDPSMLGEMILEMDEPSSPAGTTPRGISTTPMSEQMVGAVIRLLECLKCPLDSRMLGRQTVREIVYRVLCDEQGGALRALASRDEHFTRIARVVKYIHTEYARPFSAEEMAKRAGMSVSVFHHHFKLVTASSPLQYLKRIRLDRARVLMAHDGHNASTAARAVGYESPSQFGREFKRLFGVSPAEEAENMRARLVANEAS